RLGAYHQERRAVCPRFFHGPCPQSPGPNDLLPFLAWIVREEVLCRGLHLRPRRAGQDRALARGRERRSIAACAAVVKDLGRWWVPDGGLFYT
ncbi:unnamed protein product, partial [Ectocarpus sp. 13 AM-2016]